MRSAQHKETSCPGCGAGLDASTDSDGDALPSPGDLSVCAYCTAFLAYEEDLALRLLTLEEITELPDETRIQLQRLRKFFTKHRRGLEVTPPKPSPPRSR